MKNICIVFALFLYGSTCLLAQSNFEEITIKNNLGGYQFYQGENRLSVNELAKTLKTNSIAYKQFQSGQNSYRASMIFGTVGGFLIGYPIGTMLGGGEPNWTLAGVGVGLAVISIPFTNNFKKNVHRAVDTYNQNLQSNTILEQSELQFAITGNGFLIKFHY